MRLEVVEATLGWIVCRCPRLSDRDAELRDLRLRAARFQEFPLFENWTDAWEVLKVGPSHPWVDMHDRQFRFRSHGEFQGMKERRMARIGKVCGMKNRPEWSAASGAVMVGLGEG